MEDGRWRIYFEPPGSCEIAKLRIKMDAADGNGARRDAFGEARHAKLRTD